MYSGESVALDAFGPLDSLASGPIADVVCNERRRFRVLWGVAKSTACEGLGNLGERATATWVRGLDVRSVRAAVALDVAADVTKSAI